MDFEDYRSTYRNVHEQCNMLVLVGNGFDIQVLSDLNMSIDTRYVSFYHFLKMRNFNSSNCIFSVMEDLKKNNAENWSDIENAIEKLIDSHSTGVVSSSRLAVNYIAKSLTEIQGEFAEFLNQVVTPSGLTELGNRVRDSELSLISFVDFLGDLSEEEYRSTKLVSKIDHGTLFNFHFINFNYTFLFDDFIYLDQAQFNPHPHSTSDRHIFFHPNPRNYSQCQGDSNTNASSYLVTNAPLHPHGVQTIPRSLLFGIDAENNVNELAKPYWAQNDVKYAPLIETADCFIIFGTSLGKSDRWWWRSIVDRMKERADVDVLLYWRVGKGKCLSSDDIRKKFAEAAGYEYSGRFRAMLRECVRVILYGDDTPRAWLNTNLSNIPEWRSLMQFPRD